MTPWKALRAHLRVASAAFVSKSSARFALLTLIAAFTCWAQDPFSSLGGAAQTISTGQFVTGLVEFAIVIAGLLLAFKRASARPSSGRNHRRRHARALRCQVGRLDTGA
jgi:hypothetical protein